MRFLLASRGVAFYQFWMRGFGVLLAIISFSFSARAGEQAPMPKLPWSSTQACSSLLAALVDTQNGFKEKVEGTNIDPFFERREKAVKLISEILQTLKKVKEASVSAPSTVDPIQVQNVEMVVPFFEDLLKRESPTFGEDGDKSSISAIFLNQTEMKIFFETLKTLVAETEAPTILSRQRALEAFTKADRRIWFFVTTVLFAAWSLPELLPELDQFGILVALGAYGGLELLWKNRMMYKRLYNAATGGQSLQRLLALSEKYLEREQGLSWAYWGSYPHVLYPSLKIEIENGIFNPETVGRVQEKELSNKRDRLKRYYSGDLEEKLYLSQPPVTESFHFLFKRDEKGEVSLAILRESLKPEANYPKKPKRSPHEAAEEKDWSWLPGLKPAPVRIQK